MNRHTIAQTTALLLASALAAVSLTGCGVPASASVAPSSEAASSEAPASSAPASSAPASSAPVSSAPASSAPSSTAPVSSAPAVTSTPAGGISLAEETTPSGHYNNTVDPYYSQYVLVCGDYALEIIGGASPNASYANTVTAFAEQYPKLNVACAIIPKSSAFNHPDQYASEYNVQKNFIDGTYALMGSRVKTVDAFGEMAQHAGEYMFYRTDHHWNSLGAYYASVAYGRAMGIQTRALADYQTVFTSGYVGSLYTFCGSPKPECLRQHPDVTVGRLPRASYTMTYTTGGVTYAGKAVDAANSGYLMFMEGDQAYTDIVTGNQTGRKLLVFKESYGNAFVPYMIDYYDEIIVLDIRQETPSTASIIAEHGITDALIINNMQAANTGEQITRLQAKTQS